MSKIKASDLFIKALENEGVEYIFGIPGEENLDFLESLRHSDIKLILTRHEQAAGFMAAAYGRFTGKPGVCLSTLGPGATNFMTPAAYAHLGAMPILMITGQKPIKSSKQGHFQIIDVVEMMRPVTKYTSQIVNVKNIPSKIREAFRLAVEERPGAAHLELPEDIASEEIEDYFLFPHNKIRRPAAESKAVAIAVEKIQQARRPLLLIGAGANRKLTSKMLVEFIDKTGIPFFNTQMGKGVIPENHPLFLGTAALSEKDFLHNAIDNADLIINVGHDVVEKPPFFMRPGGINVVHINFFSATVDNVYFPQYEVLGDIANSIWQIKEALKVSEHWDFQNFMKVKEQIDQHICEKARDTGFPIKPQRLVNDIRQVMPADGILSLDNGMYKIWFARNYRAHEPNTILLDNALATMGAGLPCAMTASLIYPERKVMAICGDGGFLMNSQELETAVRLKLNLVVVILEDKGYGMIKWKQESMGFPDFGLDFANPNFVDYAKSYGAHGVRVEGQELLQPTLQNCLNSPGVHLVVVPVDYSENKILTQQLKEASRNL